MKIWKKILVGIMILFGAFQILKFIAIVSIFGFMYGCTDLGLSRTQLAGEIIVLSDKLVVNEPIPLVLKVPEEIDQLHKEMWDVYYIDENENQELVSEEIMEHNAVEDKYTEDEVKDMFQNAPRSIYNEDETLISKYSTRIALFTPQKSGQYLINIMGYYKTTSPRDVASIEVIVNEKE